MAFVSAIMVLVFAMAIIMIVYVIGSLNKIIITERLEEILDIIARAIILSPKE